MECLKIQNYFKITAEKDSPNKYVHESTDAIKFLKS